MIWVMLFLMKGLVVEAQSMDLTEPIMDVSNYFEERSGLVAVEAEYFYQQSLTGKRKWYRTSQHNAHDVTSEEDSNHSLNASGKAYIEILPDTRVTHEDKLIVGENFSNEAGKMAIIHYKVKINNPGRYYVWLRAFSTGSEDNGVHVGLNGKWPDHGQRMQWHLRHRHQLGNLARQFHHDGFGALPLRVPQRGPTDHRDHAVALTYPLDRHVVNRAAKINVFVQPCRRDIAKAPRNASHVATPCGSLDIEHGTSRTRIPGQRPARSTSKA